MKDSTQPPKPPPDRKARFAMDFSALEAWIEETPPSATVKGMYVDCDVDLLLDWQPTGGS